ncbi:MAG: hypothetical protein PVJ80_05485 [Gemmatimonadota bacterium]|jgi:TolB-like protein
MSDTEPRSNFGRFMSEMKRRHVVRFSVTYAAAAFIILQIFAEVVFPAFGIGEGGLRLLIAATILGYLPAVVLAWIYDITKEGIRRTEEGPGRRTPYRIALATFALVTIGLTGAVGWYLYRQGAFEDDLGGETALGYDPTQPIRSLVVLPLQDNSPDQNQGYIASGMHDEIIAQLGTIEGVRVVSRTTSMRYADSDLSVPQIGSELGVDVVIEGSVTRSGDQVRVTLQIYHAATDASIENLQIDGSADDLLSLQEETAQRVATVIGSTYGRGELGRTAQGIPRAAQEAYYQGRYEMERRTPDAYQRALQLFEDATRLAPRFAEARAGLATARFRLALVGLRDQPEQRTEQVERAERDAAAALALDSTSMEVREVYEGIRAVRARFAASQSADSTGAGPAGEGPESVAIDVGAIETIWLATMTSFGQQIRETVRDSLGEGPEAATQLTFEARVMMARGGFSDAVELLDSVVVAYPETQEAWDQLLRAHVALGHLDQTPEVVARWNAAGAPGAPGAESLRRLRSAIATDGYRGYWTWRRDYLIGQQEAGSAIVLTDLAAAHAAIGESDEAFALLDRALDAGEPRLYALPSDPVWDPLRGDPRFRQIEEEIQRRRLELSAELGTG